MAAASHDGIIRFAGGSENPYNYDGIGYNGKPSLPSGNQLAYSVEESGWQPMVQMIFEPASMDHRGLIVANNLDDRRQSFCVVGGMRGQQQVTTDVNCW